MSRAVTHLASEAIDQADDIVSVAIQAQIFPIAGFAFSPIAR